VASIQISQIFQQFLVASQTGKQMFSKTRHFSLNLPFMAMGDGQQAHAASPPLGAGCAVGGKKVPAIGD